MCNIDNKVNIKSGLVRFKFTSSVQSLSTTSGPVSAGAEGYYTITINDGDFTPATSDHSVVWDRDWVYTRITCAVMGSNTEYATSRYSQERQGDAAP